MRISKGLVSAFIGLAAAPAFAQPPEISRSSLPDPSTYSTAGVIPIMVTDACAAVPAKGYVANYGAHGWLCTPSEEQVLDLIDDAISTAGGVTETHVQDMIDAAIEDETSLITSWADARYAQDPIAISEVTGLQTALDGKQASGSYLTTAAAAAAYQPLTNNGTAWAAVNPSAYTNTSGIAATYATQSALTSGLAGKANTSHTHAQSDITNLTTDLAAKAPLASPALTGTPTVPTAAGGTNTTQAASTAFVTSAIAAIPAFSLNPTPSTPSRSVNTNFTPSASKLTWVGYSYNLSVTNPLLAGSSSVTVQLLSDTNTTPTTVRASCTATSSVALTVTIQIAQVNPCFLSYMVPPGHNARIAVTTSGTASATSAAQTEETLG